MGVYIWANFACGCLLLSIIMILKYLSSRRGKWELAFPPGPAGRPILGHLHLMKRPLHRSLHTLAQAHGPLLYLHMGRVPTVVVSSPHWAKLFLHTHDRDFSDRPSFEAGKRLFYNNKSAVLMEYGPLWRELRKLYTVQMLTTKRIEMFEEARREEMAMAMEELSGREGGEREVEIRKVVFGMVGNMMTRMLFGRRMFGEEGNGDGDGSCAGAAVTARRRSMRFEEMIEEMAALFGAPVIGDLIPCLAWLDVGGYKKRMHRLAAQLDLFLEDILTARLNKNAQYSNHIHNNKIFPNNNSHHQYNLVPNSPVSPNYHHINTNDLDHNIRHDCGLIYDNYYPNYCTRNWQRKNDLLDNVANFESSTRQNQQLHPHEDFLSLLISIYMNDTEDATEGKECIKAIILDLLSAGTETTTTTVEWAMAELLRNPQCMSKLQEELAAIHAAGPIPTQATNNDHRIDTCKLIKDEHLPKLPYLQALIKETLRLHPPLPIVVRQLSKSLPNGIDVGGYHLPLKTRLLVNVWALGRDTNTWGETAASFCPDKFLAPSSPDFRGQHFELLPFGSGRRGCPGMNLGLSMVGLVLANLVYFFAWKLPSRYTLDLSEAPSRVAPMAKPLIATIIHKTSIMQPNQD